MSSTELRDRLRRKAAKLEDVDPVMSKLREYAYINDERFAENYAAVRRDTQGFGRGRVLRDLRQRRVSSKVAETAVTSAFQETDEAEMVDHYLQRRYRNKNLIEFLRNEKNLASAFRRLRYAGFSAGVSIRVLKRYAARADELENAGEPEAEG